MADPTFSRYVSPKFERDRRVTRVSQSRSPRPATPAIVHIQALHRRPLHGTNAAQPASAWLTRSTIYKALGAASTRSLCLLMLIALVTVTCSTREPQPIDVSVRDVVIDPYAVDGKLVRLIGLLRRTPDGDALYWHEADLQRPTESHAVAVELSTVWPEGAERRGTYVVVEGIFEADPSGGDVFNGALLDARHAQIR